MELIDTLQVRRRYEDMFEWLLVTHEDFSESDQEEDIADNLQKHIKAIMKVQGRNYNHTLKLRANKGAELFYNGGHELKKRIYRIMWKGYINMQSFRGIIPAETLLKERDTPVATPLPERLPENLR